MEYGRRFGLDVLPDHSVGVYGKGKQVDGGYGTGARLLLRGSRGV